MTSFSRSRDMIRAEKFKMGHVILTTPLSGTICHPQSWTRYVNLHYHILAVSLHQLQSYERRS